MTTPGPSVFGLCKPAYRPLTFNVIAEWSLIVTIAALRALTPTSWLVSVVEETVVFVSESLELSACRNVLVSAVKPNFIWDPAVTTNVRIIRGCDPDDSVGARKRGNAAQRKHHSVRCDPRMCVPQLYRSVCQADRSYQINSWRGVCIIKCQANKGIAFGHGIVLKTGAYYRRLIAHKLAHVMQYERFGGIEPFLVSYMPEAFPPHYPNGPLEQEAEQLAKAVCCSDPA
jgi:hypothetical protein